MDAANKMKRETWTFKRFLLLQFIPTDRYQAVFIEEHEDKTWSFRLEEIEGVALAQVTVVDMSCASRNKGGHPVDGREDGRYSYRDVVGVQLGDTGFMVCDDCCNFTGLIRRGQTPSCEGSVGNYVLNYGRYRPEDQRKQTENEPATPGDGGRI